jgi:signal transduction histidine kinase
MGMVDFFDLLKKVYFFTDLTESELKKIANVCHKESVPTGGIVFLEGSAADKFYIVVSGAVEVWKDYNKSNAEMLAVHGPGHMFGEMALIDDKPRSATIASGAPSVLLHIRRNDFQKIIKENASIALSVMRSVSEMVRKSNESFVEGLREQNVELERAYKELKETQGELIRAEKLSAVGKFSSLILHDIRNPLSILRGYAEMMLLHPEDNEKVKKNVSKIINEADRINRIASELLDYARGEIRLNISVVDMSEFMTQFIESISDKFAALKINIKTNLKFKGSILFDKERMNRVFMNLATNSAKAMPKGGDFSISLYERDNFLYFDVSDTGEGMSEDTMKKIFEPFFSVSKSGGTGLGMSIVKSIIEAHDGVLTVASKETEGSTFTIALPIKN